jgi:hypothetical protein
LRRDLESAFHVSFADVRIHADIPSAAEARRLDARAFTVGHDISFAAGAYRPHTPAGRRLIAHELTHVVQQAGATPTGRTNVGERDSPAEREAAAVADRVGAERPAGRIQESTRPLLQRQPDDLVVVEPVEPVEAPAPAQAWSPSVPGLLSIQVDSPTASPREAWGSASGHGVFPLSRMGHLTHFCSTPATYSLRIRFYLDSVATPRPQPFRPPQLSVVADFLPSGGPPRRIGSAADPNPRYAGAGWPLSPAFGELFTARSSQSGMLAVQASLTDPDTATRVSYGDTVQCELVPCA